MSYFLCAIQWPGMNIQPVTSKVMSDIWRYFASDYRLLMTRLTFQTAFCVWGRECSSVCHKYFYVEETNGMGNYCQ
jgi:hypothetical protein